MRACLCVCECACVCVCVSVCVRECGMREFISMDTLVMHAKCLNNPFDQYYNKMTKKKKSVCEFECECE